MLMFGSVTFIYPKVYRDLLLSRGGRSERYVLLGPCVLGNSSKFPRSKTIPNYLEDGLPGRNASG